MTKEELEEALKVCYTKQQLCDFFNLHPNTINYHLKKFNLQLLMDSHAKDERGNKYGKLTVINLAGRNSRGEILWNCICDCGKEIVRSGIDLRRKRNKIHACQNCLNDNMSTRQFINHTGEKSGELTIVKPVGKNSSGNILWLCNCSCGNKCIISSGLIGKQQSCGCLISKGEYFINQILVDLQLNYKTQCQFDNCVNSQTGYNYKFDFVIFDNKKIKFIIEYNGQQHYYYTNNGWNTKEQYEKTVFHDKEKMQYCQQNNIPLLIIPYTIDTKEGIKQEILHFLDQM